MKINIISRGKTYRNPPFEIPRDEIFVFEEEQKKINIKGITCSIAGYNIRVHKLAINKYFCKVPSELASDLPKTDRRASSYVNRKKCTFHFTKVSEMEVFLLLALIVKKRLVLIRFILSYCSLQRWKYLNH